MVDLKREDWLAILTSRRLICLLLSLIASSAHAISLQNSGNPVLSEGARYASSGVTAYPPFQIPATGELYELEIGSEESLDSPIEVFFESPGSISLAVGLLVSGPPGMVGVLDSFLLPKGVSSYHEAIAQEVRAEPAMIQMVNRVAVAQSNQFIMPTHLQGQRMSLLYHLHKDACLPRRLSRYVSRLTLWLSEVDREHVAQGFRLQVAVKEFPYPRSRAATMKPEADGMYRGEPILLMSSIQQYGGEFVRMIKRRRGRVRTRRVLPVVKYVYYRGYGLSLARLGRMLRGGKATFELSNGSYVYGVCFDLVRRRQSKNGYPIATERSA